MTVNFSIQRIALSLLISYQVLFNNTQLNVFAFRKFYEPCIGKYQIGLDTDLDIVDHEFQPIEFIDFDKTPKETIIRNNGHLLDIDFKYDGNAPMIKVNFESTVGVKGTFRLGFLYFQWFKQVPKSLAHENLTFPGEFHAVFYDVNARSFELTFFVNKSVIVLAFGVKIDSVQPQNFNVLQKNLKYVRQYPTKTPIANHNLKYWIKADSQQFYVHEGTLIIANCENPIRIWVDFIDPLTISPELVNEFQKIKAADFDEPLMEKIQESVGPSGKVFRNANPLFFTSTTEKLSLTNIQSSMPVSSPREPQCRDKHQMDLSKDLDAVVENMKPIEIIDFDKMPSESILERNGNMIIIHLNYNDTVPMIKVNFNTTLGVEGTFRLKFLYFQWFDQVSKSLSYKNLTFPGELHALFYNEQANILEDFITMDKGIIVLAFAIKVDPSQPFNFDALHENLENIQDPYSKATIANLNLEYWLKAYMDKFFVYESSLLEFYCKSTIIWVDFIEPIVMPPNLVKDFLKLEEFNMKPIMKESSKFFKPKGKVFKNFASTAVYGPSPPLSLQPVDENSSSTSGSEMLGSVEKSQVGVFILFNSWILIKIPY